MAVKDSRADLVKAESAASSMARLSHAGEASQLAELFRGNQLFRHISSQSESRLGLSQAASSWRIVSQLVAVKFLII